MDLQIYCPDRTDRNIWITFDIGLGSLARYILLPLDSWIQHCDLRELYTEPLDPHPYIIGEESPEVRLVGIGIREHVIVWEDLAIGKYTERC